MDEFTLPDENTMYRAFVTRNSSYEGIFVTAVKTTGIFCRPTCSARKPKKENIEYFPTTRDALLHGYRPCKICRPMYPQDHIPDWLQPLMDEVSKNPALRMREGDMIERGLDPNRVRRWFKRHHGMTFHGYQRALRITTAFGSIKHGDKVIDAAFDSGYESLSGFTDSFRKHTGFSPTKSSSRKLVIVTRILTPLGPMLAGAVEQGICLLEFVDRPMIETQIDRLKRLLKAEFLPGTTPLFDILEKELNEYFQGKRQCFSVPLAALGTPFQQRVWEALLAIPYGQTKSYKEQAQYIGQPKAVRAVARANGDNRIAIIIPCHRVIGVDGKLVGYGGGLWRKKFLLELESGGDTPVELPPHL